MIVRINQLDAARAEQDAGWPGVGPLGPLKGVPSASPAPAELRTFELLILGHDEQNRPLPDVFRQAQLRQIIPQALIALREGDEEIVVRLDGPLAEGELLAGYRWLTEADGRGRFAVSAAQKREDAPAEVIGGIRLQPSPGRLAGMCADGGLGLGRSVRLRAFCVPGPLVNTMLEISEPDDARWGEVLERAGVTVGTTRGLRSLHIQSRRFDAAAVKSRIMRRLIALATPGATVPA
jgi:hypothetical protein